MKKIILFLLLILAFSCKKENQPPTCEITHPENNASFELGDNIAISIEASDSDGTIDEIQLYFDDTGIASLKELPYTYTIETNDYIPGVHLIRATAIDKEGEESSDEIQISISATLATVTTNVITVITDTSAVVGGNIVSDGGAVIIERGICWSNSENPTIDDNKTVENTFGTSFSSILTGLNPFITYYVRAYATNSIGTGYGESKKFIHYDPFTSVADFDYNIYPIVTIGEQIWMAENLNVTSYSDGTAIPLIESNLDWMEEEKAYCWYGNDENNGNIYGALYTWGAAMNGNGSSDANPSGIQGVCPSGWHLPSDAEWKQLEMYLGMSQEDADDTGRRGTDEGGKLKEDGYAHWNSPNEGATNESGFTALPGGFRDSTADFSHIGWGAYFWTATEINSSNAWERRLVDDEARVERYVWYYKQSGLSVRCVKDSP